ncbi:MAG: hypothetical protein A4E73_02799 [Syntrophaceae bacterium PtaU1.Bin231]|nr:MAG: hypothetical protein A4E73_02799 [Syntrophaceae bacterium PtaU1.Bin231]
MISFSRTQVIGAEFPDGDTIRFRGVQEDHIYGMEIAMDVRISTGEIVSIRGEMKRYTNWVCPQAIPVLQKAVGIRLREDGWDGRVMREIGRKGCEHFAEIIIECGRCLDTAVFSKALHDALKDNPALDPGSFLEERMRPGGRS